MREKKAIFILTDNNSADQIIPIIYKLSKKKEMAIDIVLWSLNDIDESDYRIQVVSDHENVRIIPKKNNINYKKKLIRNIKQVGKAIPSDIPERVHNRVTRNGGSVSTSALDVVNSLAEGYDSVVVGLEWNFANSKTEQMSILKKDERFTTLVLPHGDAPFQNALEKQSLFDKLLESEMGFIKSVNLYKVSFTYHESGYAYDYYIVSNDTVSRRIKPFIEENKIKILGSARYNQEWLDVVSDHVPSGDLPSTDKIKIVMFNRDPDGYFVSKEEIMNTIRLLTQFPDTYIIIKEHPRAPLLDSTSEITDQSNLEIKKEGVQSAALIEWGDIFLSVGTSISFEPVVRNKPVLSLSYTHANYTTISHYLPDSDIRSKDDLYYTLHSIVEAGLSDFYDEKDRQRFIHDMVTSGHDSVLDKYADFVESCLEKDDT